jgi:hypothetical protein
MDLFLLAATLHHPDLRAERFQPRFKEQGDHQNHHRLSLQGLQRCLESSAHQGMNQLLQPLAFHRIGKHKAGQGRAIQGWGTIASLQRPSVTPEHRQGGRRSWTQHIAGHLIGVQNGNPVPFCQHTADGAFPRSDPPCEPNATCPAHPADQPTAMKQI